jgi:hypothetical protein
MFMTHHRFPARLQTQYQTSRFEAVRRGVAERYRFGIALLTLKQHPIDRGPDPGTSLSTSDRVRESLDECLATALDATAEGRAKPRSCSLTKSLSA